MAVTKEEYQALIRELERHQKSIRWKGREEIPIEECLLEPDKMDKIYEYIRTHTDAEF